MTTVRNDEVLVGVVKIVVAFGLIAAILILFAERLLPDRGPTPREQIQDCIDRGGLPQYATVGEYGSLDYLGCVAAGLP